MAVWCSGYYGMCGFGLIHGRSNYKATVLRVAYKGFFDISDYSKIVTITVGKCLSGVNVTTNLQSPGLLKGSQKVVSVNQWFWVSQRDCVSYPQWWMNQTRHSLVLGDLPMAVYAEKEGRCSPYIEHSRCRISSTWHSMYRTTMMDRDYHGFENPCGLRVGYSRVRMRARLYRPSGYLYPWRGLAVYPRVFFRSLNRDQPWPTRLI